jgi:BRCA2, oligonucleotide/oligosaccharide-binding, domain 3
LIFSGVVANVVSVLGLRDLFLEFTPFANDFDAIVVVVKICEMSKFQLVYLADADFNLLIKNFWGGIKLFAYDNNVRIRNL